VVNSSVNFSPNFKNPQNPFEIYRSMVIPLC
jgi:hypothetical protein